ncbi:MAG: DNA mismatch repair protein MutS [Pseudomonadota bacterium]|nr:DNA mismatch repair protein MutS [Pseudomonadota bacterium]
MNQTDLKMPIQTKSGDAATPMMAQYFKIKEAHSECLLFYRMGDFYELFFEDADKASKALDITLTHRGKHKGIKIPMCGVPVHASEVYLNKLIQKGFRVAVCEQIETPEEAKKRGAKSVVSRAVVRVVTPGTITEESLLDAKQNNYLAALADVRGGLAVSWLDITTGLFMTCSVNSQSLISVIARIEPGELLVPESLLQNESVIEKLKTWENSLVPLNKSQFDSVVGRKRVEKFFNIYSLDVFGNFTQPEIAASGALISYVEITQKGQMPHLQQLKRVLKDSVLEIDFATRRNLELTRTLSGETKGSVFSVMDYTKSSAGCRMLNTWLCSPLTNVDDIQDRLDGVEFFYDHDDLRDGISKIFKSAADIQRPLSRLTLGRGGPRDIVSIRDGLMAANLLQTLVKEFKDSDLPLVVENLTQNLGGHLKLVHEIDTAIIGDPPVLARDGGFVASGYSPKLDKLIALRDDSRKLIVALQAKYCKITKVPSLKIKNNNVLGYFIEVSPSSAQKIPVDSASPFLHRQTLVSAVRFSTSELNDLESQIKSSVDQALELELKLFGELVSEINKFADSIALTAQAIAMIDVISSLADLAVANNYVRPKIDNTRAFRIFRGRHPVVERMLDESSAKKFIPNDCDLANSNRLWLLTGPNMAGKSTFLRQNALIAIMAQMGSFVPADSAHIGIIDRIFSRVGAADDLARGHSTFMVEMVETATILNQAGDRSLVILDEIGRGTATFDGLSIAWATLEQIHDTNKCRALFATHYHELTSLESRLSGLCCYTVRVKEWQDDIIFLHEVIAGSADRSYGIHVGRLAGLPKAVIKRAEEVLEGLQSQGHGTITTRLARELPLFQSLSSSSEGEKTNRKLLNALEATDPDEMTPLAALKFIYDLKLLSDDSEKP